MAEFEGKRFVVTGAASGIGHALAERLLAAGAEVTSLDRNTPTAPVAKHIEVDLANPRSIDTALESLEGPYDGLMNVAGIPGTAPADTVVAVNSLAVRHLTEAFFELLAPGGSVTIVASTAGFGWPDRSPIPPAASSNISRGSGGSSTRIASSLGANAATGTAWFQRASLSRGASNRLAGATSSFGSTRAA